MPILYEHSHTVSEAEIDSLGHASNLAYVRWMQDAAVAHSAAQGWPTERYLRLGAGWVVRSHQIEYLLPAYAGQQLIVRTWIADFKRISSLRRYQIVRRADEALLARAETKWVFINFEQGVPRRVPDEVAGAFVVLQEP